MCLWLKYYDVYYIETNENIVSKFVTKPSLLASSAIFKNLYFRQFYWIHLTLSVSRFDRRTLRTQRQQQYVRKNGCARSVVCLLFAVVLWVFSDFLSLTRSLQPEKTQRTTANSRHTTLRAQPFSRTYRCWRCVRNVRLSNLDTLLTLLRNLPYRMVNKCLAESCFNSEVPSTLSRWS